MEGEYFQIFATPRTGTHLSALRCCALQPWQRRSSDARRATQAAISLARVAAAARVRAEGGNRRRETGRPRRRRWPWTWCRRWRWDDLGRPGRLIVRGRLGKVPAAAATFGGEVCFVLCEEWLDEVRLKQKMRIFWQKCWKIDSFLINSFTSRKN